jgi:hypothetical protein
LEQLSTLEEQIKVKTQDEHVLRIESTPKTPFVYLDSKEGIMVFFGRSVPDNARVFYEPVLDHIDKHSQLTRMINVYFRIYYCGSSSGNLIRSLMKSLDKLFLQGQNMNIYWFQEGDNADMYTDGELYQGFTSIPYNIIELEDEELDELDAIFMKL